MTADEFAAALAALIGDAEDAGVSHEDLIEALECAAAPQQSAPSHPAMLHRSSARPASTVAPNLRYLVRGHSKLSEWNH